MPDIAPHPKRAETEKGRFFEGIEEEIKISSLERQVAFKKYFLKSDNDLEDARHIEEVFKGKIGYNKIIKVDYWQNMKEINEAGKEGKKARIFMKPGRSNREDRMNFVVYWADYARTHSDKEWSRQQNVVVNSQYPKLSKYDKE